MFKTVVSVDKAIGRLRFELVVLVTSMFSLGFTINSSTKHVSVYLNLMWVQADVCVWRSPSDT